MRVKLLGNGILGSSHILGYSRVTSALRARRCPLPSQRDVRLESMVAVRSEVCNCVAKPSQVRAAALDYQQKEHHGISNLN